MIRFSGYMYSYVNGLIDLDLSSRFLCHKNECLSRRWHDKEPKPLLPNATHISSAANNILNKKFISAYLFSLAIFLDRIRNIR